MYMQATPPAHTPRASTTHLAHGGGRSWAVSATDKGLAGMLPLAPRWLPALLVPLTRSKPWVMRMYQLGGVSHGRMDTLSALRPSTLVSLYTDSEYSGEHGSEDATSGGPLSALVSCR